MIDGIEGRTRTHIRAQFAELDRDEVLNDDMLRVVREKIDPMVNDVLPHEQMLISLCVFFSDIDHRLFLVLIICLKDKGYPLEKITQSVDEEGSSFLMRIALRYVGHLANDDNLPLKERCEALKAVHQVMI